MLAGIRSFDPCNATWTNLILSGELLIAARSSWKNLLGNEEVDQLIIAFMHVDKFVRVSGAAV